MPGEALTKSKTILRRRSRTNRISRALIRWPHASGCLRSIAAFAQQCRIAVVSATRIRCNAALASRWNSAYPGLCSMQKERGHCGIGRAYADASVHCNLGQVESGCATHLRRSQASIYRFAASTSSLARRTRVYPAHAGCGYKFLEQHIGDSARVQDDKK